MSRKKKRQSRANPPSSRAAGKKSRASRYKHPIPDRNALLDYLRDRGKPQSSEDIAAAFDVRTERSQERLLDQLNSMARAGQVLRNRGGDFCLVEKLDLVPGVVRGHPDGFGFVMPDDGSERIHLSPKEMRTVFHGDRVAAKVEGHDRRDRPYGRIVEILERGTEEIAGQFIRERGIGLVIPDNPKIDHRILIPKGEAGNARAGQVVVARILDYPSRSEQPTGTVVQVLGDPAQSGIATDIAIHAHGIPTKWPREVTAAAEKYGRNVPTTAKRGRVDLRDMDLVTIDGQDARDFDDAVYCESSGKGWRLVVAIADVAHYVEQGSALDKEATKRGTSAYFPDRVVPMLPENLSNGLCSLNPKVDRLCMVCDMRVGQDGKVARSRFYEAVMRSSARLTYGQVGGFLEGERNKDIPEFLHKPLGDLHELFKAFARNRQKRGAIELDLPQTRMKLDERGAVVDIVTMPRNDAHRLIEECMIAANVQAAKFLRHHKIAGLYRVHDRPDEDKFAELRDYLVSLGLKVPHPGNVQPRDFNRLTRQVKDRADSTAISMAMLRSLPQAKYTPQNAGHFGLALDAYAHFTSPIRRYPDLLVHRAIRHIVRGGKAGKYTYSAEQMERLGAICSAHERRAEDATREVEAHLKCQFMEDKIGRQFSGIITGVTNFGAFVQLTELAIDGLVHVSSLDNDYYHFDSAALQLVGERYGKVYRIGDALEVSVHKVDLETRRIDFRLAEKAQPASPGRSRRRRRSA